MRSLRWMLGLGLVIANCRSESLTPTDTDSGAVDSGGVVDSGGMDAATASDACVRSGAENTATACADNVDNDCDGHTDCGDFDCSLNNPAVTFCPAPRDAGACTATGMENTAAACTDGVDNDCDGFRDCADFDCPRATCPRDGGTATACDRSGPENTAAACTDGVDNDCDGFRDCNDFDCPQSTCPRDGGAPSDRPACDSGGSRENTNAECNDGIDNDCDGFTDCVDFSCRACNVTACVVDGGITTRDGGVCLCQGAESSNGACGDRVDNDCDGFVDCADFDCTMSDGGVVTVCSDASVPRD